MEHQPLLPLLSAGLAVQALRLFKFFCPLRRNAIPVEKGRWHAMLLVRIGEFQIEDARYYRSDP